ncbi:MAG: hypothetical protein J1E59_07720 [Treponema sp.]|nr:hypothetical protein [Treponema sp.]
MRFYKLVYKSDAVVLYERCLVQTTLPFMGKVKPFVPYHRRSALLICEGNFADDLDDQSHEKKHMTARKAKTIARDTGGAWR